MARYYSRYVTGEEKKNIRRAFFFIFLTVVAIVALVFFGIPTVAKFAAMLNDLRKSDQPIDANDKTPPAPPRINRLPEATNKTEVEVSGSTENGATVILTYNSKTEEVVADADGKFSFSVPLNEGDNSILAKVKDQAGNESQETDVYIVVFDDTAPTLDISSPSDGSSFFGEKQRQLTLSGTTEAGVTLTINDRVVQVEDNGAYSFTSSLGEGSNSFNLKSTDKAGNQTEKTITVNFSP